MDTHGQHSMGSTAGGNEFCNGTSQAKFKIVQRPSSALSDDGENPPELRTPYAVLPSTDVFEGVGLRPIYAIDCGGSLVKVVYTSLEESEDRKELEARLKFRKFQRIEHCLSFVKAHMIASGCDAIEAPIRCTGGGAFKHENLIAKTLGVEVERVDEMEALVNGCCFLLKYIEDESFTYHHEEEPSKRYSYRPVDPTVIFPFQLVNIGTGISVIKIEDEHKFSRIGGSTMGGGAFTGLGSLLTGANSFDELLAKAEKGDHRNVDTLVSDIPPSAHDNLRLPADLIAGSFGKCVDRGRRDELQNRKQTENDMAKSLLLMVSNCIGQMATLYGKQHQVKRIYFGGYFIRKHPTTMRTISFAVNYWSKGEIEALFLKHEGYIGAVGAFLQHMEKSQRNEA
ncbi:Pantothenate kinase 4 [Toxocara canis]|uniref:pantothenate kinase n=1 Tax=Toxocara canis TaxID=6265 RepID=A0A0B2VW83_TOXCA|nr:Pantothenate kinase 4 [Toxocara canis]